MGVDTAPPRHHLAKGIDDILRAADKAEPAARRALLAALNEIRAGFPDVTALLEAGRIDAAIKLFHAAAPKTLLTEAIRDALLDAATSVARVESVQVGISFNNVNTRAVRWAEREAAKQITGLSTKLHRTLNGIITDAMGSGASPAAVAREIRSLVGLTQPHARFVENLFLSSIRDGVLESHAVSIAERNSARLIRFRAETIARTETLRAANMGQQLVWDEALDTNLLPETAEKVWLATGDDRTCPICAVMDGKIIGIRDDFSVTSRATSFTRTGATFRVAGTAALKTPLATRTPPAHPRCRCTITIKS